MREKRQDSTSFQTSFPVKASKFPAKTSEACFITTQSSTNQHSKPTFGFIREARGSKSSIAIYKSQIFVDGMNDDKSEAGSMHLGIHTHCKYPDETIKTTPYHPRVASSSFRAESDTEKTTIPGVAKAIGAVPSKFSIYIIFCHIINISFPIFLSSAAIPPKYFPYILV
jgi:hypothetical protein